ncbi:MAG: RagB/SusD family nutrient uptake outer membrane protein [Saprospiraceae bacterium]|nr:RagB/SusD family nutrient uptake outer membrane protein [Candidatus Brachybacter algidus]MBK8747116.1 RagB/SusD family nutrient uptake outer membrane protein [Candidatus Brachybacter algidus]
MKNLLYFISFFTLGIALTSCDSFLDKEPLSQIIDESADTASVYTGADAETGIAAVYSGMKTSQSELFFLDHYVNGDAQSDNSYAGADNPDNFQIDDYKISSTNRNISRDWKYFYGLIGTCNGVIERTPKAVGLDAGRRDEIIGEASFMRGFLYFGMVQLWGGVPIVTKPVPEITSDNFAEVYSILYPDSKTQEEVYTQIINDLTTAVNQAPTAYGPTKMRGTKAAAHAILAKVYATRQPADWNKVSEHADAVIASGFSLLPSYEQLWDGMHENSAESIFELDCIGGATGSNWGSSMFVGKDWKKFNTPTHDLVDLFVAEQDIVRKNSSILFQKITSWTDVNWDISNYPFCYKMRNTNGTQNQILLRLADILLLKAEALTELGQLDAVSGAQYYVNLVRSRAKLAPTTATTADALRTAIAKERRLELAFEGHRWYDLKRTGKAIETMTALGYTINENKLLFPIPQGERDKNINLKQNPGY